MARRGEVATGVTWGEMSGPLAGIARFPRVRLGHAPTPLDAAPNLGAALGVELWIKRDDCTGLAFGGNKVRQLEFELGEAQARGADTVLVTGAVQSNLVRLTASGARRLGMEAHVQLEDRVEGDGELYRTSGNLLLDRVLGATLHTFPVGEDEAAADAALERLAAKLAAEGRRPYVIHSAPGHPPLGGLGYVTAAGEVMEQAHALGIGFDAVVCASGSGLTHAGILVGMRALGERAPVYGICVRREARAQGARVAKLAAEIAAMIGRPAAFEAADVEVDDGVLPPGYGRLNGRGARKRWRWRRTTRRCSSTRSTPAKPWRASSPRCARVASPREAGCSSSTPAASRRSSPMPAGSGLGSRRRRRPYVTTTATSRERPSWCAGVHEKEGQDGAQGDCPVGGQGREGDLDESGGVGGRPRARRRRVRPGGVHPLVR